MDRFIGIIVVSFSLSLSLTVLADDEQQIQPDIELLEFLADWETDDGQWISPEEVEQLIELATDEKVKSNEN